MFECVFSLSPPGTIVTSGRIVASDATFLFLQTLPNHADPGWELISSCDFCGKCTPQCGGAVGGARSECSGVDTETATNIILTHCAMNGLRIYKYPRHRTKVMSLSAQTLSFHSAGISWSIFLFGSKRTLQNLWRKEGSAFRNGKYMKDGLHFKGAAILVSSTLLRMLGCAGKNWR